jgi:uncharacterized SAM-binding protein YcdF (DUF218 family)
MKTLRLLLPYLLLLVTLDLTAGSLYLYAAQARLPIDSPSAPSSPPFPAGVLFFSDFGPDGAGLGPTSLAGVERAAALYRSGRVQNLVCVGGLRERAGRNGAQRMCDALEQRGLPKTALAADAGSFDTVSNWRQAEGILHRRGWHRVLLIAAPLHLYRIADLTRGSGLDITLSPSSELEERLRLEPLRTWAQVHREWIARAAMWLPGDLQQRWIKRWREWTGT